MNEIIECKIIEINGKTYVMAKDYLANKSRFGNQLIHFLTLDFLNKNNFL